MTRIEQLRKRRREAHERLQKLNSKVYRAFLKIEAATYADGALTKRHKELIAVSISVVIDCESCMEWHITQAANDGASHAEILEAVEVAIEMAGGPATASARFALEVMDAVCSTPDTQAEKRDA